MIAINALARRSQDDSRSSTDTPRIRDSPRLPDSSSQVVPPPHARLPNRGSVNVSTHHDIVAPLPRHPVNFPSSLLLTYDRQGFPSGSLRNYYAGSYIAPNCSRASQPADPMFSSEIELN